MNASTKVLTAILALVVAFIAWSATLPSEYLLHVQNVPPPHPYAWGYPLAALVVGGVALWILAPWTHTRSLGRAAGPLVLFLVATAALGISFMHAPPVHGHLFLVFAVCSLAALLYSGTLLARKATA